MPLYRIILIQTNTYDFEVEAETMAAAHDRAEAIYEDAPGVPRLPDPNTDHDTLVVCRDCGDELHGDDGNEEALPGLCGPCSIAAESDPRTATEEAR